MVWERHHFQNQPPYVPVLDCKDYSTQPSWTTKFQYIKSDNTFFSISRPFSRVKHRRVIHLNDKVLISLGILEGFSRSRSYPMGGFDVPCYPWNKCHQMAFPERTNRRQVDMMSQMSPALSIGRTFKKPCLRKEGPWKGEMFDLDSVEVGKITHFWNALGLGIASNM